jgi:hypothetical protein
MAVHTLRSRSICSKPVNDEMPAERFPSSRALRERRTLVSAAFYAQETPANSGQNTALKNCWNNLTE